MAAAGGGGFTVAASVYEGLDGKYHSLRIVGFASLITDRALLRASHIKPRKDCEKDDERLDVHNGILFSALWDAAFDKELVTFSNTGELVIGSAISAAVSKALTNSITNRKVAFIPSHQFQLDWHREYIFAYQVQD